MAHANCAADLVVSQRVLAAFDAGVRAATSLASSLHFYTLKLVAHRALETTPS
jgi:hypothetical protein